MTERLRVMHAVRSDRFAGVEQFILRLALAQAEAGHRVTVVGGAPERMAPALGDADVAFAPAVTAIDVARAVHRQRAEFDVVNTHMSAADGAAAFALSATRSRPALVATRHFAQPRGGFGPFRWDWLMARRFDAEIAISSTVAAATGLPSTVVRTGLPAPGNEVTPAPVRERIVLMAQRLQPEKHSGVGVRAFAASGLASEGWHLTIAGDGPERDELARLAAELGVGAAVQLVGFRSDVPALMETAGLFLATCPREGLGIAVLEAMDHRLPVVAAGAAGHLELLEGLDPRALFVADDPQDAGRALTEFAHDEAARASLAAAAAERRRTEYSLDAQVAGTDAVYRRAIARRRG